MNLEYVFLISFLVSIAEDAPGLLLAVLDIGFSMGYQDLHTEYRDQRGTPQLSILQPLLPRRCHTRYQ